MNNDILEDPDITKVTNESGETPLHWLAASVLSNIEKLSKIIKHKDFSIVKDFNGNTPKDILLCFIDFLDKSYNNSVYLKYLSDIRLLLNKEMI